MNRFLTALLLCIGLAAQAAHVQIDFRNALSQIETNTPTTIYPLSTPLVNGSPVGPVVYSNPIYTNTATGTIILSNMVAGDYAIKLRSTNNPSKKETVFYLRVPTFSGLTNAAGMFVGPTNNNLLTSYDARYDARYVMTQAASTNSQTVSGGLVLTGPGAGNESLLVSGTSLFDTVSFTDSLATKLRYSVTGGGANISGPFTINLGFSSFWWETATGNLTLSISGAAAGRTTQFFVTADSSTRNLSFSGITFMGSTPTQIAANKTGLLELWCPSDTLVMGRWTVQP